MRPGTNVTILNALAYTVVEEGLEASDYINERCDTEQFSKHQFIANKKHSPEATAEITGVNAEDLRAAAISMPVVAMALSSMDWVSPSIVRAQRQ